MVAGGVGVALNALSTWAAAAGHLRRVDAEQPNTLIVAT